jgi:hypothetical protein
MRNISTYVAIILAAVLIFRECNKNDSIPLVTDSSVLDIINVLNQVNDTVTVVRRDTTVVYIRDTVIIKDAKEYVYVDRILRDSVIVYLSDTLSSDMRVFEGKQRGDSCTYEFAAGVSNNELAYLKISSECKASVITQNVTKYVTPKNMLGVKGSIDVVGNYGVGCMYISNNIYLGAQYGITNKSAQLEAGYFFKLKSKNKNDTIAKR